MEKDLYRSQFRMPQELYEKLKAAAIANNRSANAELVSRLEDSFSQDRLSPEAEKKRRDLRAWIAEEVENYLNPKDLPKP